MLLLLMMQQGMFMACIPISHAARHTGNNHRLLLCIPIKLRRRLAGLHQGRNPKKGGGLLRGM